MDRALEAVELTGRADDRFRTYSLGMRQRLGVAAALLHEPELLVLDEPTNGLDPDGISEVRRLLGRLRADGRTIIVSSHQLAQLEQLADHIIVLDRGRVITSCSLAELRRLAVPQVRIEFLDADTELLQQLSAASPAIEVNGLEGVSTLLLHPLHVGARSPPARRSSRPASVAKRPVAARSRRFRGFRGTYSILWQEEQSG